MLIGSIKATGSAKPLSHPKTPFSLIEKIHTITEVRSAQPRVVLKSAVYGLNPNKLEILPANDIVKSVILCENLIVYGNRYRSTYKTIDEGLNEATELFRKGKYKQSMDLSLKVISEVDDTVFSRFGLEE